MVADIEELENLDASEIHACRFNAKEVHMPNNGENSYSLSQMENSQVVWKRVSPTGLNR